MDCRFFALFLDCFSAEQKGDAPKTCQTNQGIHQATEQGKLASKEPGHQVKLKNADQTPVETTDNGQNQSDGIHIISSF